MPCYIVAIFQIYSRSNADHYNYVQLYYNNIEIVSDIVTKVHNIIDIVLHIETMIAYLKDTGK